MVSYVPQVREEQMVRICLCVRVCVAPPMIVGAWSMAVVLWQLLEYAFLGGYGKLCSSGKDLPVCTCMCGSVHDCGCVVDGSSDTAVS